jgi:hypothetical protein
LCKLHPNISYPSNAISASSMSYLKFWGFTSVIPTIVGIYGKSKRLLPLSTCE